jgi:hypothetical protein
MVIVNGLGAGLLKLSVSEASGHSESRLGVGVWWEKAGRDVAFCRMLVSLGAQGKFTILKKLALTCSLGNHWRVGAPGLRYPSRCSSFPNVLRLWIPIKFRRGMLKAK